MGCEPYPGNIPPLSRVLSDGRFYSATAVWSSKSRYVFRFFNFMSSSFSCLFCLILSSFALVIEFREILTRGTGLHEPIERRRVDCPVNELGRRNDESTNLKDNGHSNKRRAKIQVQKRTTVRPYPLPFSFHQLILPSCDACRKRKICCTRDAHEKDCSLCKTRGESCKYVLPPNARRNRLPAARQRASTRSSSSTTSIPPRPVPGFASGGGRGRQSKVAASEWICQFVGLSGDQDPFVLR